MHLLELDKELTYWRDAASRIVTNVYELYEHPACRALGGRAETPAAPVSGVTLDRAKAAVTAVSALLSLSLELDNLVKRAAALRADLPLLFPADRIREIELLLTGKSIRLADEVIPLAERSLLGPARKMREFTARELLDVMLPAYEAAKRTIFNIDETWTRLPCSLEAMDRELDALEARAARIPIPFDTAELRRKLQAARAQIMSDPLAVQDTLTATLDREMDSAKQTVQSREQDRAALKASLSEAEKLLRDLETLAAQASEKRAERECKLTFDASPDATPRLSTQGASSLEKWLAKLRETASGREWIAASVGVKKWLLEARQFQAALASEMREDESWLERRLELRGRLDALHAKASACGLSEEAALGELARNARALLYSRPTPMPEAARLLDQYQARLNTLVAQKRALPKS